MGSRGLLALVLVAASFRTGHAAAFSTASSMARPYRPALQRPTAAVHTARPRPVQMGLPGAARALLLAATPAASTIPARAAVLPVASVVTGCILGMIPFGIKSVLPTPTDEARKRRKLDRRVFTGCALGAVVSSWIFSGTYAFLAVFSLMAVIAENEYYGMARENGCYPTWKLGLTGSIGMYVAATSSNPVLRDALFPIVGTVIVVYLLVRQLVEPNTPPTTMNDVAVTFMGIYLFGYMPSFWIRLRCLTPLPSSLLAAQLFPSATAATAATASATTAATAAGSLASALTWPLRPLAAPLAASTADFYTVGCLVQWWTMLSVVAADIGAYFSGKAWGRTPLIKATSPGKTVEGFVGGCASAIAFSAAGATLMRWPRPLLTGCAYGLMCAVMALIGDLTVSLLKRSAGVKDTGQLLPGHGGLLDRVDSFLLVAAPAYFFVRFFLPLCGWGGLSI